MSKKQNALKHTKLHEFQQKANGIGGICEKCGRQRDYLTVDHIVPQSFIISLGLQNEAYDHDWNFQLLCRACNLLKANKLDFTEPRTIINLKRYIEIAESIYPL